MVRLCVERLMHIRCCCEQDAAGYRTVLYPNHFSEAPDGHHRRRPQVRHLLRPPPLPYAHEQHTCHASSQRPCCAEWRPPYRQASSAQLSQSGQGAEECGTPRSEPRTAARHLCAALPGAG